jgi:phosphate transport system permease protein
VKSLPARQAVNLAATVACGLTVLVALVPLLSVLWLVVSKGAAGLSPGFFVHRPTPPGEPGGGVGPAIVGTFTMVSMACLVSLPLGIGAGAFLAERGEGMMGRAVRFTAEVLAGVPSIVVGIVAYAVLVVTLGHFSALAGACALSLVMIPPLARSTEEFIRLVPHSLREASLALGVPAWRTSLKVVLRTALPGIVTASLLAVARAAGETAPLLFTALNNQYWSLRASQPMASLTVQIFNYAISPYESWHAQAWTAALVLLLLVGILNVGARLASRDRMQGTR